MAFFLLRHAAVIASRSWVLLLLFQLSACGASEPMTPDTSSDGGPTDAQPGADASARDAPTPDEPDWVRVSSGVTAALRDVWVASATEAYIVGHGGTIFRYDGTTLTPETGGDGINFEVVSGDGAGLVLALGKRTATQTAVTLIRNPNGTWSPDAEAPANAGTFFDLVFLGPDDALVVAREIWRRIDGTWTSAGNPFRSFPHAIWAAPGSTAVFAGGQNFAAGELVRGTLQTDGSIVWGAGEYPGADIIDAMWGFSDSEVFAAHYSGNLRWTGTAWTTSPLGSGGLFDLWGTSATNLFGVGAAGRIAHLTTAGPGTEDSGVSSALYGISGAGSLLLAVGQDGVILRRTTAP